MMVKSIMNLAPSPHLFPLGLLGGGPVEMMAHSPEVSLKGEGEGAFEIPYNKLDQRGVILVSVLFVMLFLGILLTIALLRLEGEVEGTLAQSRSTSSLYVAEAGLERVISRLRIEPSWRVGFTDEPLVNVAGNTVGYYTVVFGSETSDPPWTRIDVTSTGMLAPGNLEYSRTIEAQIVTANPAQFFAFSPGELHVASGANITGSLFAHDLYFDISLAIPGGITVTEPIFYVNSVTENDPNGEAPPNVDIPVPTQTGPVAFPTLNIERYRALADPDGDGTGKWYFSGDHTFADGISLGSGDNGVIFAEGDIYIEGEIEDPVTVVANGNIYITGDIEWEEDPDGNPKGKLGLFAKEDVYIAEGAPSRLSVRALIIADGGSFQAQGVKASKSELTFYGVMTVRGREDLESGGIDLAVYPVRNYDYDENLIKPPALPYVTYIANLSSWSEG